MDKQRIQTGLVIYSIFFIASIGLLITYSIKFNDTKEYFYLVFIAFTSFLMGYSGMRFFKFYNYWMLYKKYGVKGTWGE